MLSFRFALPRRRRWRRRRLRRPWCGSGGLWRCGGAANADRRRRWRRGRRRCTNSIWPARKVDRPKCENNNRIWRSRTPSLSAAVLYVIINYSLTRVYTYTYVVYYIIRVTTINKVPIGVCNDDARTIRKAYRTIIYRRKI